MVKPKELSKKQLLYTNNIYIEKTDFTLKTFVILKIIKKII